MLSINESISKKCFDKMVNSSSAYACYSEKETKASVFKFPKENVELIDTAGCSISVKIKWGAKFISSIYL